MNIPRFKEGSPNATNLTKPICHPAQIPETIVLFTIAVLGMGANIFLLLLIILKRPLRRWSQGLLFHQGIVDCMRASLLVPLGVSVLVCQRLPRCSVIETVFLLLVTVSTVNILTSVINDAPLLPEQDEVSVAGSDGVWTAGSSDTNLIVLDSPQCVVFGLFIIWFASFTINLGPTFLSGALSSSKEALGQVDACPMVYTPFSHYVLNVLWVCVNVLCVVLTGVHLRKLYRDLTRSNLEALRIAGLVTTMISVRSDRDLCESQHIQSYIQKLEEEGIRRVKMFIVILVAYMLFWGPLFVDILVEPGMGGPSITYGITLHVAFAHAFVNPTLLLILHKDLRQAASDLSCCHCWERSDFSAIPFETDPSFQVNRSYMETTL